MKKLLKKISSAVLILAIIVTFVLSVFNVIKWILFWGVAAVAAFVAYVVFPRMR